MILIKLTWKLIDGADTYTLYRGTSSDGPFEEIRYFYWQTPFTGSWVDESAVAGITYYYRVLADEPFGNGSMSEIVSRTCDLARPTVTLSTTSKKITVKWDAVEGATKYEVYRSTDNSTWTKVTTTTGTSYANSGLTAGTKYYYKVRALCDNSAATSAYSSVKNITCK